MTQRFLLEGHKGKAICEKCANICSTTYRYRDVPFSDGKGLASGILVGVCDTCNTVLSIPAQSTPKIKRDRNIATQSIEAVLPAPYLDILDLACFSIDPNASTDFRKKLLLFYIHKFALGKFDVENISEPNPLFSLDHDISKRRLSMKVSKSLAEDFTKMVSVSKLSKTDFLKNVVGEIKRQVIDDRNKDVLEELRTIAYLG
ncbi:hypothetical protein SAMN05192549_1305 [Duganella sacchari]|uniref:Uncharacterized protein n=1 Tax=Duganella sacchari TaxID=551987 RepID=A0A1M7RFA2_9BURK|nr:hypothetical protein [Duganella sacchari]SHN44914.1 hypothetical protein SAMN05192549_1305 [Duganella sacchari]